MESTLGPVANEGNLNDKSRAKGEKYCESYYHLSAFFRHLTNKAMRLFFSKTCLNLVEIDATNEYPITINKSIKSRDEGRE